MPTAMSPPTPVKLASGALSADGQASLADNKVSADIKGALHDISHAVQGGQGRHRFRAECTGPAWRRDLSLTVDSDRLSVAEREITGLKLTATGKADAANPAANVQLTGNVAGQALQGSAVLATSDGKRAINGLLLSLGKNKISGDLALDEQLRAGRHRRARPARHRPAGRAGAGKGRRRCARHHRLLQERHRPERRHQGEPRPRSRAARFRRGKSRSMR